MSAVTDKTVAEIIGSVKENEEELWGDITAEAQRKLKELIEGVLQAEVNELLECSPYERSDQRTGYRSGWSPRTIATRLGEIPIRMPRVLGRAFESKLLKPYQTRVDELDIAVLNCFVFGCSTRGTAKIISYLSESGISHQTVSNITRRLDREVRAYHARRLADNYEVLFCDGLWVKVKDVEVEKQVILYVMGLRKDGVWEIVDFHVAPQEDTGSWGGLLKVIRSRGVLGRHLQLIVGDEAGGLKAALKMYYPHVKYQACAFHKIQNVLKKVKRRERRKGFCEELSAIWQAKSKAEAVRRYWAFCRKHGDLYPTAIRCLQRNFKDTLRFYEVSLPKRHRFKTNNVLERYLEEVRRRIIPMRYFKNEPSAQRIIYALAKVFDIKQVNGDMPIIKFQQTF